MNTRIRGLGAVAAAVGAILAFVGVQAVMLRNGFAPVVFYASVIGAGAGALVRLPVR